MADAPLAERALVDQRDARRRLQRHLVAVALDAEGDRQPGVEQRRLLDVLEADDVVSRRSSG